MKKAPIKVWGLWDVEKEVYLHPFFRTKQEVVDRLEKKITESEEILGRPMFNDFRKVFIPKEIIID